MKTTTKFSLLAAAAAYPSIVLAEIAGAYVPAAINAENALIVYAAVGTLALMISDYSRKTRILVAQAKTTRCRQALALKTSSARSSCGDYSLRSAKTAVLACN